MKRVLTCFQYDTMDECLEGLVTIVFEAMALSSILRGIMFEGLESIVDE